MSDGFIAKDVIASAAVPTSVPEIPTTELCAVSMAQPNILSIYHTQGELGDNSVNEAVGTAIVSTVISDCLCDIPAQAQPKTLYGDVDDAFTFVITSKVYKSRLCITNRSCFIWDPGGELPRIF